MPGEVEVEKEDGKTDESTAQVEATAPAPAPPRPVVGIIYPPPEVRSILSFTHVTCDERVCNTRLQCSAYYKECSFNDKELALIQHKL